MQIITDWLQLVFTVILVFVTTVYVCLTKRISDVSQEQSILSYIPVIGIKLESVGISKTFGPNRRNMSAKMELTNIGNAPAVDVSVDGEVLLERFDIQNEKEIPARFEPSKTPFIQSGEKITDAHSPNFGNKCIEAVLKDFEECSRLNEIRIATDPSKEPYFATHLRIIVYYQNTLNQFFESIYEVNLGCDELPNPDESKELHLYPDPAFRSGPISKDEMEKLMASRNKKRELCGW